MVDVLIRALDVIFAAGMIGCAVVLVLTFVEDLETIFSTK
jgi:hypothetical protein